VLCSDEKIDPLAKVPGFIGLLAEALGLLTVCHGPRICALHRTIPQGAIPLGRNGGPARKFRGPVGL